MPLECDDFVFRKVNWPLPLNRGGSVGFRLTAKLPLSVTKSNCRRPLIQTLFFRYIQNAISFNKYNHYIISLMLFSLTIYEYLKIISINNIIINRKICTYLFNPFFFVLLIVKSFEMLPKHNGYGFISESFASNWYIFTALTIRNCCFHYNVDVTQIFLIL